MPSMGEWGIYFWAFLLVFMLQMRLVLSQNDYSVPITCYFCYGKAENSTCSDPIDTKNNPHVTKKECITGVCVKWTRYKKGVLYMERTCSNDLNFHINMIDGVCRTERNGNGYLCMCGKHLCNTGHKGASSHRYLQYTPLVLTGLFLLKHFNLIWDTGHFFPH